MPTQEQELHNTIQRMDNNSKSFDIDLLDILIRLNARIGTLEHQFERLTVRLNQATDDRL